MADQQIKVVTANPSRKMISGLFFSSLCCSVKMLFIGLILSHKILRFFIKLTNGKAYSAIITDFRPSRIGINNNMIINDNVNVTITVSPHIIRARQISRMVGSPLGYQH